MGSHLRCSAIVFPKRASPASKVYSVAIKDRAAIMMGAQRPDGAYWYLESTGTFVTSSHYASAYPGWVDAFNASGLVECAIIRKPTVSRPSSRARPKC